MKWLHGVTHSSRTSDLSTLVSSSSATSINTLIKILSFGKIDAVLKDWSAVWLVRMFVCFPCPAVAFMWAIISRCESEGWWNSGRHEETPVRNKIWLHMWRTALPSHFSTHQPACTCHESVGEHSHWLQKIPWNVKALQWTWERELTWSQHLVAHRGGRGWLFMISYLMLNKTTIS